MKLSELALIQLYKLYLTKEIPCQPEFCSLSVKKMHLHLPVFSKTIENGQLIK